MSIDESKAGLTGLHVCAFESRMADEMRMMLERQGARVTVAPSMREIPLGENPAVFAFGEQLFAGGIDVILLLTGVGTRAMVDVLELRHARAEILAALQKTTLVVRGPKPASVLREWKMRIDHLVREPNTWRELLELLDAQVPVRGKTVAVQEYGLPNPELYSELQQRGATVVPVPVYRWELPEDVGPLEAAILATVAGEIDVLLFTSAQQVQHVLSVADRMGLKDAWLKSARKTVVASIGPTASETLISVGLPPDLQPEHPKIGHLVLETAKRAGELRRAK